MSVDGPAEALLVVLVGGALVAILDEASMSREDHIRSYKISDPIKTVHTEFLKLIKMDSHFISATITQQDLIKEDFYKIPMHTESPFVFDFQTTSWGVGHYSFFNQSPSINYQARVRLIQVANMKVLWERTCPFQKGLDGNFAELVLNQGQQLKEKLSRNAEDCAWWLARQFSYHEESGP